MANRKQRRDAKAFLEAVRYGAAEDVRMTKWKNGVGDVRWGAEWGGQELGRDVISGTVRWYDPKLPIMYGRVKLDSILEAQVLARAAAYTELERTWTKVY